MTAMKQTGKLSAGFQVNEKICVFLAYTLELGNILISSSASLNLQEMVIHLEGVTTFLPSYHTEFR